MPLISSGRSLIGVSSPGTANTENTSVDIWTPGYHGFKAWNFDPGFMTTNSAMTTANCFAIRIFCPTAFTLANINFFVGAAISGGTAELTTTNTNSQDLTALSSSLTVAANSFAAAGRFVTATTAPAGFAVISYTGGGGTTTLTGCTTNYGSTGTMGAGATIRQSVNLAAVYTDNGLNMLGVTSDQVTNWGTSGYGGAGAAATALNIINGATTAITANSYLWAVFFSTAGTTPLTLRGMGNNSSDPNVGLSAGSSYSNYRIAKVTAGTFTSIPATLTSPQNNTSWMYPWVALS